MTLSHIYFSLLNSTLFWLFLIRLNWTDVRETYFLLKIFIFHRQNSSIMHQTNVETNSEFYTGSFGKNNHSFTVLFISRNINGCKGWILFFFLQCCLISSHSHPFIRPQKVRLGQACTFLSGSLDSSGLCGWLAFTGDIGLPDHRAWTINYWTVLPLIVPSHMAGMRNE